LYRRIRRVGYPLTQFSTRICCMILTYLLLQVWRSQVTPGLAMVLPAASVAAWVYWLARTDQWAQRASFLSGR